MQPDERPRTSIGPLAAALAKAQLSFGPVTRSKTVTVQTKTGGSYKFSYAPLDTILDAVRKPLSENGLAVVQMLTDGGLETTLVHESGGYLTGHIALPQTNDIQALGSAVTYLRRYAIQAILGIAAEEDDDGNQAAGNRVTKAAAKHSEPTPIRPSPIPDEPTDEELAKLHGEPSEEPWDYAAFRAACKAAPRQMQPDLKKLVTTAAQLFPTKGLELHEPKAWTLSDREWRQLAVTLGVIAA